MIYWDTSVILKLYVEEKDSARWQHVAMKQSGPLHSSHLMQAEFALALRAKEQRKEVRQGSAARLVAALNRDVDEGHLQLHPVSGDVISTSTSLAARLPNNVNLRTLDALHLATAMVLGCKHLATADHRLADAAKRANLDVID